MMQVVYTSAAVRGIENGSPITILELFEQGARVVVWSGTEQANGHTVYGVYAARRPGSGVDMRLVTWLVIQAAGPPDQSVISGELMSWRYGDDGAWGGRPLSLGVPPNAIAQLAQAIDRALISHDAAQEEVDP